jgi:hypothetical protein
MKWVIIALVALIIAVSPVEASRQRTPVVCSRIVASGPVHNGQYNGINCREGHYLTVGRADGVVPARGAARVSRGAIVDSAGVRWQVVR